MVMTPPSENMRGILNLFCLNTLNQKKREHDVGLWEYFHVNSCDIYEMPKSRLTVRKNNTMTTPGRESQLLAEDRILNMSLGVNRN